MRWWIASFALALAAAGCSIGSSCGEGTVDRNGICEIWNPGDPANFCGPGTHPDYQTHSCLPDYWSTTCDPATTTDLRRDDGVDVCVGVDGPCTLDCPAGDPGHVTLCGGLVDLENSWPVGYPPFNPHSCDPTVPGGEGTCALQVTFYDAEAFVSDPFSAPELKPQALYRSDCGFVMAKNLPAPDSGFLVVSVDDGGNDNNYARTATRLPAKASDHIADAHFYVLRRSTDLAWTQTAGDPFGGQTFSEVGVHVPIFRTGSVTAPDVAVSGDGSTQIFYFSDASQFDRITVDPLATTTGPDGTALVVGESTTDYAPTGGAPTGCSWPPLMQTAIGDVVWVTEVQPSCP